MNRLQSTCPVWLWVLLKDCRAITRVDLWRRGSATDHDCDNEILSWLLTSQLNSPCKQLQKRWISSVGVLRESKTTNSRYRGGNVDTKPGSAHFLSRTGYLAGRHAVSSSQKTRSFIFCWLSRKERAKSRKNSFRYIVALRFLLLLVPWKERVARVAFDHHVRLQAGARAAAGVPPPQGKATWKG